MIITLIGQEKNLGILTLTDYLLKNLDKNHSAVVGWSYLIQNYTPFLDKIKSFSDLGKNVIVKYIIPKIRFSNQSYSYPKELEQMSDVIFMIPTYREEISPQVPFKFLKGDEKPICGVIKKLYS